MRDRLWLTPRSFSSVWVCKCSRCASHAAMRKLLVLCFGVLKSKEFDPAMVVCDLARRATAWCGLFSEPKLERETVVKPRSPSEARLSARA